MHPARLISVASLAVVLIGGSAFAAASSHPAAPGKTGSAGATAHAPYRYYIVPANSKQPLPPGAKRLVVGDMNGDGKLTAPDMTILMNIVTGRIKPTPEQIAAGDVAPIGKPDGKLTVADIMVMAKIFKGEIPSPGVVIFLPAR